MRPNVLRVAPAGALLVLALLAPGGAPAGADDQPMAGNAPVASFPFEAQAPDFCGEACLAMALKHWGLDANQYRVFALTGLAPDEGRGAWTREMYATAQRIWGASYPSPWFASQGKDAETEKRFRQLADLVQAGTPCMVCCHYDDTPGATEHFRLVTAIDPKTAELTYQEPAEKDGAARTMAKERFLKLWPVAGGSGGLLILFPFPAPPAAARDLVARAPEMPGLLAQAARRVKKRISRYFRVAIEGPYVIASDQSPADFQSSREHTIRWAYTHLQDQFFTGGLSRPIEVYLFDGRDSYEKHVQEWFHEKPHTPFGYFSSTHRALIMNIATGGGTLVHEMVHPLMEEHFPGVPSWFNEGLASLFEQCGERDGKMVGLKNWRYKGLTEAIRSGAFSSLEKLMQTSTEEFYGNAQGDDYGVARYLCQYLQSQGKIEEYYRQFRAHHDADPTGVATLKSVLGEASMEKIQADWLEWLKKLK